MLEGKEVLIYKTILYFVVKAMLQTIGKNATKSVLRQAGLTYLLDLEKPPNLTELVSIREAKRLREINIKFFKSAHKVFLRKAGYLTARSIPLPRNLEQISDIKLDWKDAIADVVHGFLKPIGSSAEVKCVKHNCIIRVYNCPECWEMKSNKPHCQFIESFISGIIERLFGERVEVKETKCIAMGDEFCEFRIRPRQTFNAEDSM